MTDRKRGSISAPPPATKEELTESIRWQAWAVYHAGFDAGSESGGKASSFLKLGIALGQLQAMLRELDVR